MLEIFKTSKVFHCSVFIHSWILEHYVSAKVPTRGFLKSFLVPSSSTSWDFSSKIIAVQSYLCECVGWQYRHKASRLIGLLEFLSYRTCNPPIRWSKRLMTTLSQWPFVVMKDTVRYWMDVDPKDLMQHKITTVAFWCGRRWLPCQLWGQLRNQQDQFVLLITCSQNSNCRFMFLGSLICLFFMECNSNISTYEDFTFTSNTWY